MIVVEALKNGRQASSTEGATISESTYSYISRTDRWIDKAWELGSASLEPAENPDQRCSGGADTIVLSTQIIVVLLLFAYLVGRNSQVYDPCAGGL